MNTHFAPRFSSLKIDLMKEHGFPDSVEIGTGLGEDRHVYIDGEYVGDNDLVGELTRQIASESIQLGINDPKDRTKNNLERFRKHLETVIHTCRDQNLMDDATYKRVLAVVAQGVRMSFRHGFRSKE